MEFLILGPLEVVDDGRSIPLAGTKQRVLLSLFLLNANRLISADRLIDELWEGRPPESAGKALQVHISQLRKVIGAERIETRGHGYLLRIDRGELDAERLAEALDRASTLPLEVAAGELRAALDLWRGEPLGDLADHDSARTEIARLGELRLALLERRIDTDLALGRHGEVAPELESLVREHPFRERLRAELMLSLYRCGRQADALEVARNGRRLLDERLGLEPGESLKTLERQILDHDPALNLDEPPPRTAVSYLIGRERRGGTRLLMAAGGILIVAAVAAAVAIITRGGEPQLTAIGPDAVGKIDGKSGRVVARVSIPGGPGQVAAAGRWVWIANTTARTVTQLSAASDTASHVVALPFAGDDLAADDSGVWVLDAERRVLVRIDAAYHQVSLRIPVPAPSGPTFGRMNIASGMGALWLTDGASRLLELDTGDGHLIKTFNLHTPTDDLAVGEGRIWATSGFYARLVELDPRSGSVTTLRLVAQASFTTPVPIGLAVGSGSVWVLTGNAPGVVRVDPDQGTVTTTIPLTVGSNPDTIAAGAGSVWVANAGDGTIVRIDPSTNSVSRIAAGGAAVSVVAGEASAWVSVQASISAQSLRAATVTVPGALPLSICGGVEYGGRGRPQLLIASDLPLQGPLYGALFAQMNDAIRFELAQRGYRAGPYTVGFQPCDDSSTLASTWTGETCARNARAYARTPKLVGVVGPFNSGCALVEIPITNRAAGGPVAMVSGSTTRVEVTHRPVPPGQPDALYPTGTRNFARVVAADDVQFAADAVLAKRLGVHRLYLITDGVSYDPSVLPDIRAAAERLGVRVVGLGHWDEGAPDYAALARAVARSHPDGIFLDGTTDTGGALLVRDLRARLGGKVPIMAPDGFSEVRRLVDIAGPAAEGMAISVPNPPVESLSASGQRFAGAFGRAVSGSVEPFSIGTAQSADLLLDAIARSDGTRASITHELLTTRIGDSILGSFAINSEGDPVPGRVTIYRVYDGKAVVYQVITPPAELVGLGSR
jgi:DNA-binding SARP family transcriptional activator/streptogramin lyase